MNILEINRKALTINNIAPMTVNKILPISKHLYTLSGSFLMIDSIKSINPFIIKTTDSHHIIVGNGFSHTNLKRTLICAIPNA